MELSIRQRGLSVSPEERAYLQQRLAGALHAVGRRVRRLWLYLSDENGPRGGIDKRARLLVMVAGRGPVVIEERDDQLPRLFDRMADRLGQVLGRTLERLRERRR